jgi:hypothetical protein
VHIILSGAFIKEELQFELGELPPAFLPIGNKRLFEYQINEIRSMNQYEEIYLSVPLNYEINSRDDEYFSKNNIHIVRTVDGITIGEGVSAVLKNINIDERVSILYGDTLISDLPQQDSIVAIGKTQDHYNWYLDSNYKYFLNVWAGYFSFHSALIVIKGLKDFNDDFINFVSNQVELGFLSKVIVSNWLDLGHVATYYRSRSKLTTERSFNSISVSKNCLIKSSSNHIKLQAEASWYQTIPSSIRRLTPNFIEDNTDAESPSYSLEYLYFLPLNELYVHGNLDMSGWEKILIATFEYFDEASKINPPVQLLNNLERNRSKLLKAKTLERLSQFEPDCMLDFDKPVIVNGIKLPQINQITDDLIESMLKFPSIYSLVHGDYCFSNVLYDGRSQTIKMIDPRGLDHNQEKTIYGDLIYDLAKFYHSAIGLYDFIIADAYEINIKNQEIYFKINSNTQVEHVGTLLKEKEVIQGIKVQDMIPLVAILFLSMIPLHSDNKRRQMAFLANALCLYSEIKNL